MIMTINEKQNVIEAEFNNLENWDDKFSYLMEKGKTIQNYPLHLKTDGFLIKECQSRLWLSYTFDEGRILFYAHTDTVIVRGIVGIIFEIYSNATPYEIIHAPLTIFEKVGIQKLFSNRITGITGIIKKINEYAIQCS